MLSLYDQINHEVLRNQKTFLRYQGNEKRNGIERARTWATLLPTLGSVYRPEDSWPLKEQPNFLEKDTEDNTVAEVGVIVYIPCLCETWMVFHHAG